MNCSFHPENEKQESTSWRHVHLIYTDIYDVLNKRKMCVVLQMKSRSGRWLHRCDSWNTCKKKKTLFRFKTMTPRCASNQNEALHWNQQRSPLSTINSIPNEMCSRYSSQYTHQCRRKNVSLILRQGISDNVAHENLSDYTASWYTSCRPVVPVWSATSSACDSLCSHARSRFSRSRTASSATVSSTVTTPFVMTATTILPSPIYPERSSKNHFLSTEVLTCDDQQTARAPLAHNSSPIRVQDSPLRSDLTWSTPTRHTSRHSV